MKAKIMSILSKIKYMCQMAMSKAPLMAGIVIGMVCKPMIIAAASIAAKIIKLL